MIFKLSPTIVRKIWGGKSLELLKSTATAADDLEPIGETWEISHDPETSEPLSYLVKLIDTSEALSIQVHPGDEYARLHENSSGKTECWVILSAAADSGIYLGLKAGVTEEKLRQSLKDKASIDQLLNYYPVNAGDFFYVPAGSIHAIGKNVLLVEIQQHSGITYRVWDWNRDRELHINKSLDVINFDPQKNSKSFFHFKPNVFAIKGRSNLVSHPEFRGDIINLAAGEKLILDGSIPQSILNLNAKLRLNQEVLGPYQAIYIKNEKQIIIESHQEASFFIISK